MIYWTKSLKRDASKYAPEYILDFRQRIVQEYLNLNNLSKQDYVNELYECNFLYITDIYFIEDFQFVVEMAKMYKFNYTKI